MSVLSRTRSRKKGKTGGRSRFNTQWLREDARKRLKEAEKRMQRYL